MIEQEIKLYRNLVEVEITDFQDKREVLYWEGSMEDFTRRYQNNKAITFPIHGGRVVDRLRIQGFDIAKPKEKTLEQKISGLNQCQQDKVRDIVKKYERMFSKNPTNARINNAIENVLFPDKHKNEEFKQLQFGDRIRELKQKRKEFFESLSEEIQNKITEKSWQKLFENHPEFEKNKGNIRAKTLYFTYYNQIIDKLRKGET